MIVKEAQSEILITVPCFEIDIKKKEQLLTIRKNANFNFVCNRNFIGKSQVWSQNRKLSDIKVSIPSKTFNIISDYWWMIFITIAENKFQKINTF